MNINMCTFLYSFRDSNQVYQTLLSSRFYRSIVIIKYGDTVLSVYLFTLIIALV